MFFDVNVLELLRLETIKFSDININSVLCYVSSQYLTKFLALLL